MQTRQDFEQLKIEIYNQLNQLLFLTKKEQSRVEIFKIQNILRLIEQDDVY